MSSYSDQPQSDSEPRRPLAADELLPPVEPPSAGFILQLFVVPAVIVAVVVLLGWLVTTLATSGERDPAEIVAKLRSSSQNRWQEAFELANALRTEARNPELKNNTELADQLAKLLDEELKAGRTEDDAVKLRSFLCAALGAFHIDNGLPVLLKVARNDPDESVRGHAINAVAVMSEDFRTQDPPKPFADETLIETFVDLANDKSDMVRSQTAYALGVITLAPKVDARLEEEIVKLVEDLYPDARYNAAMGLARRGNLLAVAPLVEMLDLESLATSIKGEVNPELQTRKRNTILKNALDAVVVVRDKNPDADLSALKDAVQGFIDAAPTWDQQGKIPPQLVDRAKEVLEHINQ